MPGKYLRGVQRVRESKTTIIAKMYRQEPVFELRDIFRSRRRDEHRPIIGQCPDEAIGESG